MTSTRKSLIVASRLGTIYLSTSQDGTFIQCCIWKMELIIKTKRAWKQINLYLTLPSICDKMFCRYLLFYLLLSLLCSLLICCYVAISWLFSCCWMQVCIRVAMSLYTSWFCGTTQAVCFIYDFVCTFPIPPLSHFWVPPLPLKSTMVGGGEYGGDRQISSWKSGLERKCWPASWKEDWEI